MTAPHPVEVDDDLLRGWPLPPLDEQGDKESRGRVLVVAGSREMPGAAVLAATAALRAGAGKLVIATPQSVALLVAAAMPEARVIAMPESAAGSMLASGLALLEPLARATAAVLLGPGMIDAEGTPAFAAKLLPLFREATVVLDALAMDCVRTLQRFGQPVILTPHAGEMAHLTGEPKDEIRDAPLELAPTWARNWNGVLALKGAETFVATAQGQVWRHACTVPGLGTSGSGDVLAGIVAGLAARGAAPVQAAVWAVALHARAGSRLEQRVGKVGYLARDLPAEVPAALGALTQ